MSVLGEIRDFMRLRKKAAPNRKDYKVEWAFESRIFFDYLPLIPSIIYTPWIERYIGQYVVSFEWLIFHVGFLKWSRKENT